MRVKSMVVGVTSLGVAAAMLVTGAGCGDSGNVPVIKAPPVDAGPSQPLPKDPKKGGGASSSGNMDRNPGAST